MAEITTDAIKKFFDTLSLDEKKEILGIKTKEIKFEDLTKIPFSQMDDGQQSLFIQGLVSQNERAEEIEIDRLLKKENELIKKMGSRNPITKRNIKNELEEVQKQLRLLGVDNDSSEDGVHNSNLLADLKSQINNPDIGGAEKSVIKKRIKTLLEF